jgi:hypothetical protein
MRAVATWPGLPARAMRSMRSLDARGVLLQRQTVPLLLGTLRVQLRGHAHGRHRGAFGGPRPSRGALPPVGSDLPLVTASGLGHQPAEFEPRLQNLLWGEVSIQPPSRALRLTWLVHSVNPPVGFWIGPKLLLGLAQRLSCRIFLGIRGGCATSCRQGLPGDGVEGGFSSSHWFSPPRRSYPQNERAVAGAGFTMLSAPPPEPRSLRVLPAPP